MKTIPALGAFFVAAAIAVSGCGSSSSGLGTGDVVSIAGNQISTKAFNHWMYVAAKSQAQGSSAPVIVPNDPPNFNKCVTQARAEIPTLKKTPTKTLVADCKQLFTSLSSQVMDFLIKSYWYQLDAHKLGLKLTDKQVAAALATAKKASQISTDAQFQNFLKTSGQTAADVLYRVRISQVFKELTDRHPSTVTPAAIQAYYNSHKSTYGTPETRSMRIVLTKTLPQALAAKAALKSGKSWKTVAKKYSIDPTTKNNGGVLNGVTAGQQDAALSKTAFGTTKLNVVLGPVKGTFGYYLVEVTAIKPATQQTLAQATPLIKQTLAGTLATAAQSAVDSKAKKDWLAKTKCRAAYSMADCAGYKAPAASSSSTTTTSATG